MSDELRNLTFRNPFKLAKELAPGALIAEDGVVSEVRRIAGAAAFRVRAKFSQAGVLRVALLRHDQSTEITDPAPQSVAIIADTVAMIEFTGLIGETYILVEFTAASGIPADAEVDSVEVYTSPNSDAGGIEVVAGEEHIGEVGGNSDGVKVAMTVDLAAYQAGDSIGGKLTIAALRTAGKPVLLHSLMIVDRDNQKPTGTLVFFDADPTNSTLADQGAVVLHADDLAKIIGRVTINVSDWGSVQSRGLCHVGNIGLLLEAAAGTNIYAVFVADGAPDWTNADALRMTLGLLRD